MYMPMAGPSDDSAANPGMFISGLQSQVNLIGKIELKLLLAVQICWRTAMKRYKQKQWKKHGGWESPTILQPPSFLQMQRLSAQPLRPAQGSGGGGGGHDQVQFGEVQVQLSWAGRTIWCSEPSETPIPQYIRLGRYKDVSALNPGVIMLPSSLEHTFLGFTGRSMATAW